MISTATAAAANIANCDAALEKTSWRWCSLGVVMGDLPTLLTVCSFVLIGRATIMTVPSASAAQASAAIGSCHF
jgi:hypothetical protein